MASCIIVIKLLSKKSVRFVACSGVPRSHHTPIFHVGLPTDLLARLRSFTSALTNESSVTSVSGVLRLLLSCAREWSFARFLILLMMGLLYYVYGLSSPARLGVLNTPDNPAPTLSHTIDVSCTPRTLVGDRSPRTIPILCSIRHFSYPRRLANVTNSVIRLTYVHPPVLLQSFCR